MVSGFLETNASILIKWIHTCRPTLSPVVKTHGKVWSLKLATMETKIPFRIDAGFTISTIFFMFLSWSASDVAPRATYPSSPHSCKCWRPQGPLVYTGHCQTVRSSHGEMLLKRSWSRDGVTDRRAGEDRVILKASFPFQLGLAEPGRQHSSGSFHCVDSPLYSAWLWHELLFMPLETENSTECWQRVFFFYFGLNLKVMWVMQGKSL